MYRILFYSFLISLNILLLNGNLYSQKKSTKKSSKIILNAEKDSLVITSIPSGLNVFFDNDDDTLSTANEVALLDKHQLLNQKNYKGSTPLIIRNVIKGRYLLGISDISIIDKYRKLKMIDKNLPIRAIISFSGIPGPFQKLTKDIEGAVIYSIKVDNLESRRVIVCSYSDESSLAELDLLYDQTITYNFDDTAVIEEIKNKMQSVFDNEELKRIVNLLHRGGKISFRKGDFLINGEVNPYGGCTMDFKLLVKK